MSSLQVRFVGLVYYDPDDPLGAPELKDPDLFDNLDYHTLVLVLLPA